MCEKERDSYTAQASVFFESNPSGIDQPKDFEAECEEAIIVASEGHCRCPRLCATDAKAPLKAKLQHIENENIGRGDLITKVRDK